MSNAVTPPEPETLSKRPLHLKRYLGVIGLVLIALAGSYLAGWMQNRSEIAALKSQAISDQKVAKSNQDKCSQQLATEKRLVLLLEARRNLDQAVSALDARNFGIADQQLKKASRWLAATRGEGSFAEMAKTLDAFHFVATEDLGPQRKQVVDWIGQIDPEIVVPVP